MSTYQELTNSLKFLSILGLCSFTVNNIDTKPSQLKLLASVALLFLFAIATPMSYHQYLSALFLIVFETNNITIIFSDGDSIFLIVNHSLPIFLVLTYISVACISLRNRSDHMSLIESLLKLNALASRYHCASNNFQYSWRKSIAVIFVYLTITVTTTTVTRIKSFNSTLYLLYTILHPAITLIYFVKIVYIRYIGIIISNELSLLFYSEDVTHLATVLDIWSDLKNKYGITFSEIIMVNNVFDFVNMSVIFYLQFMIVLVVCFQLYSVN